MTAANVPRHAAPRQARELPRLVVAFRQGISDERFSARRSDLDGASFALDPPNWRTIPSCARTPGFAVALLAGFALSCLVVSGQEFVVRNGQESAQQPRTDTQQEAPHPLFGRSSPLTDPLPQTGAPGQRGPEIDSESFARLQSALAELGDGANIPVVTQQFEDVDANAPTATSIIQQDPASPPEAQMPLSLPAEHTGALAPDSAAIG